MERDGVAVRIVKSSEEEKRIQVSNEVLQSAPAPQAIPVNQAHPQPVVESEDSSLIKVKSPIVGTFYTKPSPDADVFVKVGDRVKKGDKLCIVEAMKLMNEIESTADGVIEKILLEDGEVVEFEEALFLIKP
ncbi:UNVERIFIED_CONTAM: hypothetical protein GTU68_053667 [Idotea baltica]|nr:hypothetical protein [Idotea baltica]